jgi:hypothetical protein
LLPKKRANSLVDVAELLLSFSLSFDNGWGRRQAHLSILGSIQIYTVKTFKWND